MFTLHWPALYSILYLYFHITTDKLGCIIISSALLLAQGFAYILLLKFLFFLPKSGSWILINHWEDTEGYPHIFFFITFTFSVMCKQHIATSVTGKLELRQGHDGLQCFRWAAGPLCWSKDQPTSKTSERLTEKITQLEKKIETLHQTHESEPFIDSVAVTIQGAEGETFTQGITSNVEHPITDLADTLPWICPNAAGLAGGFQTSLP